MTEYYILGCSHAMVSMIVDCIHQLHPDGARVLIVTNGETGDELPYEVEGVKIDTITHDRWDRASGAASAASCLCGVYRPATKRAVLAFFSERFGIGLQHYGKLVHPSAQLAATTQLGNGVDLGPNVVLSAYAHVGSLVTLNRAVTIGHHSTLADFVTVNPGAHIAGRCLIGDGVSIGMGASVLDGVKIGANSVIGAGSVVTRDVPESVVALGTPARVVRSV